MSSYLLIALGLFLLALLHAAILQDWRRRISEAGNASRSAVEPGTVRVSLVVPARNAADGIVALLQDLHAQRYDRTLVEVLVVDDHSTDSSAALVKDMMKQWPQLRLVQMTEHSGKKNAITLGMMEATGDLVLLTDADARCGPDRLACLVDHWARTKAVMVLMPVNTAGESGFWAWVQRVEQLALQGATIGSGLAGNAVLANGANMAVVRESFFAVGGFQGDRRASGDDLFLMRRMRAAKRQVSFLADPSVIVQVETEAGLAAFVSQRLRWAGKMWGYRDAAGMIAALLSVAMPLALVTATVLVFRHVEVGSYLAYTWALLLAAWVLWVIPIVGLVRSTAHYFKSFAVPVNAGSVEVPGVFSTTFALLMFMLYAPVIAIMSIFVRPMWKGRRI